MCTPAPPDRDVAEALLDTLDDLVRRHRGLGGDADQPDLHAELITAEVAQGVALTRALLRRRKR